jgi:ABC-2 type transport system ATP-binding protein
LEVVSHKGTAEDTIAAFFAQAAVERMTPALAIKDLRKVYDNNVAALRGISLDVEEGDFFALLGPNGAGKSTTIGIIFSLVNKTGGTIEIFGIDIDKDFAGAKQHIGIVPQEFNFNLFEKVIDIVINQGGYYGLPPVIARERAEKYLQKLGLWDKRNDRARELSGGMKRRLMIARALVHEPRLLILDEPTAGVDIEMRRSMWEFLREINEAGTTIILTTHYLEEAESLCRNIAIIDHGSIVHHSSMRELLQQLHTEMFILDVRGDVPQALNIPGFPCERIDEHSIEVVVDRAQDINALFSHLSDQGIVVNSMRNKSNRLEEMFVSLLTQEPAQAAVA